MSDRENRVRALLAAGEGAKAVRAAAGFKWLGPQKEAISRAAAALASPEGYRQLGYDVDEVVAAGVEALKERLAEVDAARAAR